MEIQKKTYVTLATIFINHTLSNIFIWIIIINLFLLIARTEIKCYMRSEEIRKRA